MRRRTRSACVVVLAVLLACLGTRDTSAEKWKPVNAAELAMASPKIDKDADAEILEWDVRVYDEVSSLGYLTTVTENYLRVKIFTDRGRETQGQVELPIVGRTTIENVQARTIQKDGKITELKKTDVFKRDVVKGNGVKIKAVTFALPNVERGAVIEYKWRETDRDALANYVSLVFQRDIPAHLVTKHVRPLSIPGYRMRAQPFNSSTMQPPVGEDGGFAKLTLADVPAFRDEPYSLPAMQVKPWVLIYYEPTTSNTSNAEAFWKDFGRDLFDEGRKQFKANSALEEAARTATAGATTVAEKVRKIVDFCGAQIKRTDVDSETGSTSSRGRKPNEGPADTWKQKAGTGDDVVELAGALAAAAGLDARLAAAPDRGEILHQQRQTQRYFLRTRLLAVRDGSSWIFFDPANRHYPGGHLRWNQEYQSVLVSDEKEPIFIATPMEPAAFSLKKASASLKLSADGTLEGDVRVEYSGHMAMAYKEDEETDSAEEREKALKEILVKRLPGAEITAPSVENIGDASKPYVNAYHLRLPGFAQRAGSRLIVQPAIFQRGREPQFTAATRTTPIYVPYPWSEADVVTIELPEGFELEQAEAPASVKLSVIGDYSAHVTADGTRSLVFNRRFSFGVPQRFLFDATSYQSLKQFFDAVAKADSMTVALRQRSGEGK